jgi:hypothetical protein
VLLQELLFKAFTAVQELHIAVEITRLAYFMKLLFAAIL